MEKANFKGPISSFAEEVAIAETTAPLTLQQTAIIGSEEFPIYSLGNRGRVIFVGHNQVNGTSRIQHDGNPRLDLLKKQIARQVRDGKIPVVAAKRSEFDLHEWNVLNEIVYKAGGTLAGFQDQTLQEFMASLPTI